MEKDSCESNHLDSNVLLPPRKRLLAGLKKRNSGCSLDPISSDMDVFEARMNSLMNFHMGNPHISLEESLEASRAAAKSAHELAVRARAFAVEKEEIAARAMAAAKKALELVRSLSEDEENKERYLKKNRMKKHLPVETLYDQNEAIDKPNRDEELARNLHRTINSSPRILKSSPGPRSSKNKRLKFDKMKEAENGDASRSSKLDENEFEPLDYMDTACRDKGKMKQKDLPLSSSSFRGRPSPEEDMKSSQCCSEESEEERTSLDNSPMWKYKAFRDATSVKENEAVKS